MYARGTIERLDSPDEDESGRGEGLEVVMVHGQTVLRMNEWGAGPDKPRSET